LGLIRHANVTGFEVRPVTVSHFKRRVAAVPELPQLWELVVIGKGGDADPASGGELLTRCPVCDYTLYSSFKNGIIVDERLWDGSDIFTVNGYPRYYLVTERVRNLILSEKLTNVMLGLARNFVWPRTVRRPEESYF